MIGIGPAPRRKLRSPGVVAAIGCIIAAAAQCAAMASDGSATYVAELHPLNSAVAGGWTTGEARFIVNAVTLTMSVAGERRATRY